jgi:hypothetical protein
VIGCPADRVQAHRVRVIGGQYRPSATCLRGRSLVIWKTNFVHPRCKHPRLRSLTSISKFVIYFFNNLFFFYLYEEVKEIIYIVDAKKWSACTKTRRGGFPDHRGLFGSSHTRDGQTGRPTRLVLGPVRQTRLKNWSKTSKAAGSIPYPNPVRKRA